MTDAGKHSVVSVTTVVVTTGIEISVNVSTRLVQPVVACTHAVVAAEKLWLAPTVPSLHT